MAAFSSFHFSESGARSRRAPMTSTRCVTSQRATHLAEIAARGHRALLVGGTGLYVQAVVDDLRIPGEDLALRTELVIVRIAAVIGVLLAVPWTVVSFTGEVTLEQGLTGNVARLRRAIDQVEFVPPSGYIGGGVVVGGTPPISGTQQTLAGSTAIC